MLSDKQSTPPHPFASGFVGVGIAAALAPKWRAPVAVGLATLEVLILAGLLISAWEQSDYAMKIGVGLTALGAIAMACMAKSDPPNPA